jgi:carbon storage regulator
MLVLTRRLKEKIVLPGARVTVEVLAIQSGAVRLGIAAPQEVTVLREELQEAPRSKEMTRMDKRSCARQAALARRYRAVGEQFAAVAAELGRLRRQLRAGADAQGTLDILEQEFQSLHRQVEALRAGDGPPTALPNRARAAAAPS